MLFVRFTILCLAVLFYSPLACKAIDFPKLHFTVRDGLPSNNIYEVYRDHQGYMWIATDKGIARYNGLKFEVFTTFDGLPCNEIFFFQEDNYNRIWLGTYNGELCYYQNGIFHNARNTPFLALPFKTPFIKQIVVENDSSVTISFLKKNTFVNINRNRLNTYTCPNPPGIDLNIINTVKFSKISDSIFELTGVHETRYLNNKGEWVGIQKNNYSKFLGYLFVQNKGFLFDEKFIFTLAGDTIYKFKADHLEVRSLNRIYPSGGMLFLATNNGLSINDSITLLKNQIISCITQDNTDNYWISTLNNGIFVLSKDFRQTQYYASAYSDPVKFLFATKGRIFYTTANNNLYQIYKNQTSCLFNYLTFRNGQTSLTTEPQYYIDSNLRYISFYGRDIISINDLLHPVIRKLANTDFWGGYKSLAKIDDGFILRTASFLLRFKWPQNRSGTKIDMTRLNMDVGTDRIFCMAKSTENTVWYSTINGVYTISGDSATQQPQLAGTGFKSFDFLDRNLVGYTHDNILLICSISGSQLKKDTIPSQNCIWDKLYRMDNTHMLISTNNLYRLLTINETPAGVKYVITTIENPFLPLQAEGVYPSGNDCYFLKDGSITRVSITSLFEKPVPPHIEFTSLKAGPKNYTIEPSTQVPFSDSKNISINFCTLSMSGNPVFYQYSVAKDGQEEYWRDVKEQEINLVHPGYGNYSIRLRARSAASDFCAPAVFNLTIAPPIYATWWFVTFIILSLAAAIVAATRLRIYYALRKKEKQHKTEIRFMKSEYKTLNALMNPHFIFNTLNNVQSLFNENDKETANEYLRIFANLIRQNMQNISKELIPLQKEIDLVTNYLLLEKLRYEDQLNYTIHVDYEVDMTDIMVPPLLIQPLVENSIKHGILPLVSAKGYIYINIFEHKGILYIEVRDNGVGMERTSNKNAPGHESFGLMNIKKRLEQLSIMQNNQITFNISTKIDHKENTTWTIVTITIPVSVNAPAFLA